MKSDPRIDAKIAAAAPFAQPILHYIRACVGEACPDAEETIKWGMPFYLLQGKPFAMMSSFKAHAAFGFWKGRSTGKEEEAMGQYGRLTSLADLPPRPAFLALIRAGAEAAVVPAPPRPRKPPKPALAEPEAFTAALAAHPAARTGFDGLPPGARRDYLEWIGDAKRPETRAARIEKAVTQCADGRKLNWKYENC
jgi:uncharacterized protein YdeI (YjbR/CyaY-like superfamily)